MNIDFYCMSNGGGTPYAPTILSDNPIFLNPNLCSECARTSAFNDANKELMLVIEGKRKLPDFLLCGHYPLTLVSKKVIGIWQKHGITGYTAFPITKLVDNKGNEVHPDFKYYNATITGRIELDFERMGIYIENRCSTCGAIDYNKDIWDWGESIAKEGSYDGSDLFVAKNFERAALCTRKMLEIVYKEKLTNFEFKHFKDNFIFINSPPPINLKEFFRNNK